MKKIILIFLAVFIVVAAEYGYAQEKSEYSEADQTIEVNAGDTFVITFAYNQFTGFKWQLRDPLDKEMLELVGVKYVLGAARFRGFGGKEIWTFKALKVGQTTISLKHIKPAAGGAPPTKEKTFSVSVKEPPPIAE